MKSNITVKTTKDGRPGAVFPIIAGFQLSGKQFSKSEQDLWDSKLKERQLRNFELFKEHLADHVRKSLHMSSTCVPPLTSYITVRLAPLRGWMRMRVHFGHVNAVHYNKKKIDSPDFNFASFEEMMAHPRTTCTFDRR